MLDTAVGASVFAAGFASIRHHTALGHARRHAHDLAPQSKEDIPARDRRYVKRLFEDTGTHLVVVGNTILLLIVWGTIGLAMDRGIASEGYLTLLGFGIVEVVVVAVAYRDRWNARRRCEGALDDALQDTSCEPPQAQPVRSGDSNPGSSASSSSPETAS